VSQASSGLNFGMHVTGQDLDREIAAQMDRIKRRFSEGAAIKAQIPIALSLKDADKLAQQVQKNIERGVEAGIRAEVAGYGRAIAAARTAGGGGMGIGGPRPGTGGVLGYLDRIGTTTTPDRMIESLRAYLPQIGLAIGATRLAAEAARTAVHYSARSAARGRGDLAGEIAAEKDITESLGGIPVFGDLGMAIAGITKNRAAGEDIARLEFERTKDEQKITVMERTIAARQASRRMADAATAASRYSQAEQVEGAIADRQRDFDLAAVLPADRARMQASLDRQAANDRRRQQAAADAFTGGFAGLQARNRGDLAGGRRSDFEASLAAQQSQADAFDERAGGFFRQAIAPEQRKAFEAQESRNREAAERETAGRVADARAEAEVEGMREAGRHREADRREFEANWDARIRKIDDAYAVEIDNEEKLRLVRMRGAAVGLREAETRRRAAEESRAEARREAATVGVEGVNALRGAGRFAEADDAAFEAAAAARLSDPRLDANDRNRAQREIDSERAMRRAQRDRGVGDRLAAARENSMRGPGGRNRLADYLALRRQQQRRLEEAGNDPGLRAAAEAENRAELQVLRREIKGETTATTTDMRSFYGGLLESAVLGATPEGKMRGKDREDILRDIDRAINGKGGPDGGGLNGAAGKLGAAADRLAKGPLVGVVDVGAT